MTGPRPIRKPTSCTEVFLPCFMDLVNVVIPANSRPRPTRFRLFRLADGFFLGLVSSQVHTASYPLRCSGDLRRVCKFGLRNRSRFAFQISWYRVQVSERTHAPPPSRITSPTPISATTQLVKRSMLTKKIRDSAARERWRIVIGFSALLGVDSKLKETQSSTWHWDSLL